MTLNDRYISAEELNALKKRFPSGSRVMLTRMDDVLSRILDKMSYQYS